MSKYVGLKQGKVHESHVISEYYCGGCGWPVTDHDSYCPECGGELHEGMGKSRWAQLFGTPERAMRTLAAMGNRYPCDEGCDPIGETCKTCPFADAPSCRINREHPERSALLKWLRGDAE